MQAWSSPRGQGDRAPASRSVRREGRRRAHALFLEGEAGIGKSCLWNEGIEHAQAAGVRILRAHPGGVEVKLAFAGLADLLDDVISTVLPRLPPPQRRALQVALLLEEPDGNPPDDRAVAAAFRSCLRQLAETGPVPVAVDDIQWLDAVFEGLIPVVESYLALGYPVIDQSFDAIEALAGMGSLDEGKALLERRTGAPVLKLVPLFEQMLARARGLLAAADNDLPAAQAALEEAVNIGAGCDCPIELARSLLALGTVQRRARKKQAGRVTLGRALEIFAGLGGRESRCRHDPRLRRGNRRRGEHDCHGTGVAARAPRLCARQGTSPRSSERRPRSRSSTPRRGRY